MSIRTSKEIKDLEAPQSVLRINKPIPIIYTNYKIELHATFQINKQYKQANTKTKIFTTF